VETTLTPKDFNNQVLATEKAVLGAVLKDPSIIPTFNVTLHSEYFKDLDNAAVWQAMLDLELDGKPIDFMTVHSQIQDAGKEISPKYLVDLSDHAPVAQNVSFYAKRLIDNYIINKTQAVLRTSMALGHGVDPTRIISELQLVEEVKVQGEDDALDWHESLGEVIEKIEKGESQRDGYLSQVSYPKLDDLAPLHKGELCIVGAIESGGKTAFALNLCLGLAKKGAKGIYFYYESNHISLSRRIATMTTEIPLNRIIRGDLSDDEIAMLKYEHDHMGEELLYKDKSQKGAIQDLIGYVKSRIKKTPCDYIVIDHMHQMPVAGKIREGFIDISRKLLALAKQENICVIALAQFRKQTEAEKDKRPHRGMIRESSSIAQDAHHIWFLHDPQYLDDKRKEQEGTAETLNRFNQMKTRGGQDDIPQGQKHAEIIIDKNREGRTDVLPAEFRRECMLWREL
jgi:replicative DNA helicase